MENMTITNRNSAWFICLICLIIGFQLIMSGCAHVHTQELTSGPYSARKELPKEFYGGMIRGYYDGYFYFGRIELIGSKQYALRKAAKLGADAVEIVDTILDAGTTYRTADYIQITPTKKSGYEVRLYRSSK